jgi:polysaccharide biosynthesis/export protein
MKNHIVKLVFFTLLLSISSCVPVKKLSYFNDIDELGEPDNNARIQKTIMPFDNLYVRVVSIDPQTNQIFNSTEELRSSSGAGTSSLIGYLVDEKGDINFPFVGNIKVGSLTTTQASEKITKALSEYVSNISVVVKFVNNQVTLVGEVNRQGMYTFASDKLTIYEALGLGGGFTRYGDRNKVMLIRREGDKIRYYRLNLSDSRIVNKEYYYVLNNDVIVVEPLKALSTSYSNQTYLTMLSTITTLIALLLFINTF